MNKNKLKSYAPTARKSFIQAVTDRANLLGVFENKIQDVTIRGDLVLINGQAYPQKIASQREALIYSINQASFNQIMETVAYTWFNRFTALRYMEIHGYLKHGFRILSNITTSLIPQILEHASQVSLPGLKQDEVMELKLANRDSELYRKLLIAQCNALSDTMPFLFERIDDKTELLLPDNLLKSDSIIRKLVTEINEQDWQEVEIMGWLYQFYISEKKDGVIGKTVKTEDIPVATQLFTPNWIVKYMVQNSLGRMWLATYPKSLIHNKMQYYIEPTEQNEEVTSQLAIITPNSINPQEITIIDPACGSGHILVEVYYLLKEIYLEQGYNLKDIPKLILEKNLYGLDIDERATQLASFALLMKACADDRSILHGNMPKLNILAIQESKAIDAKEIATGLLTKKKSCVVGNAPLFTEIKTQKVRETSDSKEVSHNQIIDLLNLFENAKTFGSLIKVDEKLAKSLEPISKLIDGIIEKKDLFSLEAAIILKPFVRQAELLAKQYDCVIANPPYMGSKGLNPTLKDFAQKNFPDTKSDLFSMFIEHGFSFTKTNGFHAMIAMESWMFLHSFKKFREKLLSNKTITTLIHMPYDGRGRTSLGINFGTSATVIRNSNILGYLGHFSYIRYTEIDKDGIPFSFPVKNKRLSFCSNNDFSKIPNSPIAYWVSDRVRKIFKEAAPLAEIAQPRQGLATADNDRFLRLWHEVSLNKIGFNVQNAELALKSKRKWFPYNKGGDFRKWYGNQEYLINWEFNGKELKEFKPKSVIRNESYYFKPCITWTFVSSSFFGVRRSNTGFIFDVGGSSAFPQNDMLNAVTGYLCSILVFQFMQTMNPTLNFQVGNVACLPILKQEFKRIKPYVAPIVEECVFIARQDWDSFETSWDFKELPMLNSSLKAKTVEQSFLNWQNHCTAQIKRMQELETENNRLFIEAYGLQDEMSSEAPEDQITLARASREADIKRLISYAIGCMMGRYSLDKPGLIYAQSGNQDFDPNNYKIFASNKDAIIPLMDMDEDWFSDDATNRLVEFVKIVWPETNLEENLKNVAESLSPKQGEASREIIRRYFSSQFYKDHIQTYKKRPIYWLFSSGRQKAFECLVYLHRYNESTLLRMRNHYIRTLHEKFLEQTQKLENQITEALSITIRNKLQKQLDKLKKKQIELAQFDDLLRHYADQRITLDLDNGVRINYGKLDALLAEVKTITTQSK